MMINHGLPRISNRCIFVLLILLGLLAADANAAALENKRLDLTAFLEMVSERHPFFDRQQLAVRIQTLEREGLLGGQDWTLKASVQTAQQHQAGAILSPERVDQHLAGIAVERSFWKTGARLRVGWNMGHARSRFSLPEPFSFSALGSYDNEIGIVYSQPLIRNAGGLLNRTPYETSKVSVAIAALQAAEDEETFLLELAIRFIDWASLAKQYDITLGRLKLAEKQLERVQEMHHNFLVDKIDVLRAADAVRAAKTQAHLIQSHRDSTGAELAVLAQEDLWRRFQPIFDFGSRLHVPEPSDANRLSNHPLRVLQVFELRRKMAQREYQALLEEKKPDLSLQIGLSRNGGGPNERDLIRLNKQNFSVGLQFTVPLGNRTAIAKANQGAARVRQIELLGQQTALELDALLQNLLVQLDELSKVLTIDDLQIASARAKTAEEIKHYNQGRSDLTFVIQAQDAEQDARLLRIRNSTSYHQLSLQLDGLLDRFSS